MGKIFSFSFLLVLISTSVFAICTGIEEGQTIRLDESGKSLETFKVQDQDGLGTCASNATSLVLHSVLNTHPDLSYIQIASVYSSATKLNQARTAQTGNQNFDVYAKISTDSRALNPNQSNDKWELGIDGAFVCAAIDTIKSFQKSSPAEGICLRNSVNIERQAGSKDTDWTQKKSLLAASRYMNDFQQKFGEALEEKVNDEKQEGDRPKKSFFANFFNSLTPKKYTDDEIKRNQKIVSKYRDFKRALSEQIQKNEMLKSEECKKISPDIFIPALDTMSQVFLRHTYCFDGSNSELQICKLYKKMFTATKSPEGKMELEFDKSFLNSLGNSLESNKGEITSENIKTTLLNTIKHLNGGERNNEFFNSILNDSLSKVTPELNSRIVNEVNEIRMNGISKTCSERKLMNYLASDDFIKDAKADEVLCESIGLLGKVKDVISSTALSGFSPLPKIKDFLLNDANLNFDKAMASLYAYDCTPSDKVRIPENLTCTETPVSLENKTNIDQKLVNELKNNRALAASVCSSIFDKPKREFAANECGSHSVGITGIQCKNGQMKYLIQNSWGSDSKALNSAIISDQKAKGAYWLDEESFFDGTKQISSMSMGTR